MDRIESFLNEDEVTDQVSSLKTKTSEESTPQYSTLGLKNASFRWNAAETKTEDKKDVSSSQSDITAAINNASQADDDHRFELHDVSLILPDGELTVITGPTASGKSALLVS